MAKKKIYAVRKGKTTGIFYSWDECSASVNGYPGAEYKSFTTKEEANSYLGNSFAVQIEEEKKDQKNIWKHCINWMRADTFIIRIK